MTVTQLVPYSQNRYKVFIDMEFAFVVYKGELRLYHIKTGEELAEESYRQIVEEVLPKRAKIRAMNLLKSRDYTVSQLKDKLSQGFYPENAIEAAIAYVESFHYLDDLRYAENFITCNAQSKSRRRIEQDLGRRGVDKDTIEKAWRSFEESGGDQDEEEQIRRLLEKRYYDDASADFKERQKHIAFLIRKGFDMSKIRKVIRGDEMDY